MNAQESRPRVLVFWPEDHNVWHGYFRFFDEFFEQSLAIFAIPKTRLRLRRRITMLSSSPLRVHGAKALITRIRPDIVVVYHLFEPSSWPIIFHAIKRRIPVVVLESMHLPPLAWQRRRSFLVPFLFAALRWLPRVVYNTALRKRNVQLFCMTERSQRYMQGLGFMDVSYGLIPYAHFYTGKRKQPRANDRFSLLYVGRVTEMKNLPIVIEAVANLQRKGSITSKTFQFTIVGNGGGDLAFVQERIKQLGISALVEFADHVPHERLHEYYRRADLFMMPSFDVLGAVTLEALEHEVPVLIADTSGFSTLMKPHAAKLIFRQNDVVDLTRKLAWCIKHRKQLPAMGTYLAKHFAAEEIRGRKALAALMSAKTHEAKT